MTPPSPATATATRPVHCTCGERVADHIDAAGVIVDGARIPFRRSTDYLVCTACGSLTSSAADLIQRAS